MKADIISTDFVLICATKHNFVICHHLEETRSPINLI